MTQPARLRSKRPLGSHGLGGLHEAIEFVIRSDTSLVSSIHALTAVSCEEPISAVRWETIKRRFTASCKEDPADSGGRGHAQRVLRLLEASRRPCDHGTLIERIQSVYGHVARRWNRLLTAFMHDTLATCRARGVTDVVFLAQDATPLYAVATRLEASSSDGPRLSLLDLSRTMVKKALRSRGDWPDGFYPGDVRPEHWQSTLLDSYLKRRLPRDGRVALVDTGVYGTLVKLMLDAGRLSDPFVFFFASKNPSIFGFLNQLLPVGGDDGDFIAMYCDTLERWPPLYTGVELQAGEKGAVAESRVADFVSVAAALVLYREFATGHAEIDASAIDARHEVSALLRHYREHDQLGEAGGLVLGDPLPTWQYAARWRESWDHGCIPPQDGCGASRR